MVVEVLWSAQASNETVTVADAASFARTINGETIHP